MTAVEVQVERETQAAPDLTALRTLAEMYFDFQKFRIASGNRVAHAPVDAEVVQVLMDGAEHQEKILKKELAAEYRRSVPPSIQTWQKSTLGLGEHTFARLIGHLGHPRIATPRRWVGTGRGDRHLVDLPSYERTVGQLWSYCGVGDPTRKRRTGQSAEAALGCGSPTLRMLLFLVSESCVKATSGPYRRVYDDARVVYAPRVHTAPCVRCGPSGDPAPIGSPWSKAHAHAGAMRKVAKTVLRDLWLAAA